jgi:hypothetical protein
MFNHGTHIVLTQRNAELCAQQIDLKRTTVISGNGRATLVVNIAESHRGIGISVVKRFSKKLVGGLTITIPAADGQPLFAHLPDFPA